ncbi:MAG: hypothetical protein CMJ85_11545 [Planctomycetes bacterium]|nr:hypothetical protein [Planctomycetota bacterium]
MSLHYEGSWSLGATLKILVTNGPATTAGLVLIGASANSPFPIDLTGAGMTGCKLWHSPDLVFGAAFTSNSAMLSLPIPSVASLSGLTLFSQGFAIDSAANAFGMSASNGGKVVIRD